VGRDLWTPRLPFLCPPLGCWFSKSPQVLPDSLAQSSQYLTPTKRRDMKMKARGVETRKLSGADSDGSLRPPPGKENCSPSPAVLASKLAELDRSMPNTRGSSVVSVDGHEDVEMRILDRISRVCMPHSRQRMSQLVGHDPIDGSLCGSIPPRHCSSSSSVKSSR